MTDAAAPGRFLALHLPSLATDRLRRVEPELGDGLPLATWSSPGGRRVLLALDRAAAGAGLRPGQALADAQAIASDLVLRPADPEGDAAALHGLALWARRYSPITGLDPPDGLLLDITGCAHLRGGEAALLRDALDRLGRAGIAARGAVAGAAATAAALARGRLDNPVVDSGAEAAVTAPLPIGLALRLPRAVMQDLARLGLRRVRDLLDQPRAPLARRFGQDLLERLDTVTGRGRSPLRPVVPPPELTATRDCPEPIVTRAAIDAALDGLLDALRDRLEAAGLGTRHVTLLAWRVDGMIQQVAIGTGLASREPAHLRRLFDERLGRLEPGLGFERMALEARATERMAAGIQARLGLGGRDEGAGTAALAEVIDRLRQRVAVHRVLPVASHWPERSVAALDPHDAVPAAPAGWAAQPRPVLLLRRPAPLEVAGPGDGPPALLRLHGAAHRIRQVAGPARLEPEWWRDRARPERARRDYYRVELASGIRLWIFLDRAEGAPRWLLHGHLA